MPTQPLNKRLELQLFPWDKAAEADHWPLSIVNIKNKWCYTPPHNLWHAKGKPLPLQCSCCSYDTLHELTLWLEVTSSKPASNIYNWYRAYFWIRMQMVAIKDIHVICLIKMGERQNLPWVSAVAYRGGVWGVQTPPRNSEVWKKLSRIPNSVENTSVTT